MAAANVVYEELPEEDLSYPDCTQCFGGCYNLTWAYKILSNNDAMKRFLEENVDIRTFLENFKRGVLFDPKAKPNIENCEEQEKNLEVGKLIMIKMSELIFSTERCAALAFIDGKLHCATVRGEHLPHKLIYKIDWQLTDEPVDCQCDETTCSVLPSVKHSVRTYALHPLSVTLIRVMSFREAANGKPAELTCVGPAKYEIINTDQSFSCKYALHTLGDGRTRLTFDGKKDGIRIYKRCIPVTSDNAVPMDSFATAMNLPADTNFQFTQDGFIQIPCDLDIPLPSEIDPAKLLGKQKHDKLDFGASVTECDVLLKSVNALCGFMGAIWNDLPNWLEWITCLIGLNVTKRIALNLELPWSKEDEVTNAIVYCLAKLADCRPLQTPGISEDVSIKEISDKTLEEDMQVLKLGDDKLIQAIVKASRYYMRMLVDLRKLLLSFKLDTNFEALTGVSAELYAFVSREPGLRLVEVLDGCASHHPEMRIANKVLSGSDRDLSNLFIATSQPTCALCEYFYRQLRFPDGSRRATSLILFPNWSIIKELKGDESRMESFLGHDLYLQFCNFGDQTCTFTSTKKAKERHQAKKKEIALLFISQLSRVVKHLP